MEGDKMTDLVRVNQRVNPEDVLSRALGCVK